MRTRTLLLVPLLAVSCTRSADRWLDRIDPVEPGDACPNGGNVVRYGDDANHDGILEDNEVSSTQYLCNPAAPASAPLLQRIDVVPAGVLCPAGGSRVSVGPDTNGNGKLDDAEIVKSSVVCATPPPAVLVRTRAEPADATCPNGGTLVESGPDRNGDGQLEDAEVERSAHVCNAPDKAALVRLDAEPKGAHCPYGGTAVRSGLDANGDGTLEDSEISSTSYACDPPPVVTTLYGDHVIHAQADVDAFKGIQRLAGALTIDQCTLASVDLPELQTIEGALAITRNATLTSIAIDSIVTPLASIDVENNALLTAVSVGNTPLAPRLSVTGNVTVSNNAALKYVSSSGLPLTQLGGTLRVENNAALTELSSGQSLTAIGGSVIVRKNPALVIATLPYVLQIGGDLDIEDNDALYNLMSVESGWRLQTLVGSLTIAGNAKLFELRGLDLLTDIAGSLTIARTPTLDNLVNILRLRHVGGSVIIRDNVVLSSLVGFEALTSIDGSFQVTGNTNIRQFFNAGFAAIGGDIDVENNAALLDAGLGANLTHAEFGSVGSLRVAGNPLLQSASYPNLTSASSLYVDNNAVLTTLSLPKLTNVQNTFQVRSDAKLAECAVDANVKSLTPKPASVDVGGNDTTATCP